MAALAPALRGRVAIVTGSVRNIGRAIALGLAEDGAAVVVNSRTPSADGDELCAEISKKSGGRAIYVVADIGRETMSSAWYALRSTNSAASTYW